MTPAANILPTITAPNGMRIRVLGNVDGMIKLELEISERYLDDVNWDIMANIAPMIRDLKPRPDGEAIRPEDV